MSKITVTDQKTDFKPGPDRAGADSFEFRHNRNAPYWAIAMIVMGMAGISTNWIDLGNFWKGYALDMTGPAWNYILFRGLFTRWAENKWRKFFTPARTYLIFVLVCFSIEGAQYLDLYNATFDPWDLLAYLSLLTPAFLLDTWQSSVQDVQT